MKEKLKELLANPPSEDYLDKLIKAGELWSKIKDDLPEQDYLDSILRAISPQTQTSLENLPDEDYLDKVIRAAGSHFEDD